MRKYIIAALAFATILANGGLTFNSACDDVTMKGRFDTLLSPTNVSISSEIRQMLS